MQLDYPAPDLLRTFIESHEGLTQAEAATQIGVVPAALNQYLSRKQRPRDAIRKRIARWTEGKVAEESWLTPDELAEIEGTKPAFVPVHEEPPPASQPTPSPHDSGEHEGATDVAKEPAA
jgi:transcriptional regulator with XRE-family HTH domain